MSEFTITTKVHPDVKINTDDKKEAIKQLKSFIDNLEKVQESDACIILGAIKAVSIKVD